MHSLSDPFGLFDFLKTRGPSIHVRLIEFWNTDTVRTHIVCFCARNCVCVCVCALDSEYVCVRVLYDLKNSIIPSLCHSIIMKILNTSNSVE